MAQESLERIGRLDRVRLLTIKNLSYISSPIDKPTTDGDWLVAGVVEHDLVLTRGPITIRLPAKDVLKVLDYDKTMSQIYSMLGNLRDGQGKEDDNQKHKSK